MVASTRIHFVAGPVGSLPAWRKLVNTISLDLYKADVVLLAGGLGAPDEVGEWLAIAADRLSDAPAPFYLLPGPGDGPRLDELLGAPGGRERADGACAVANPRGGPVALPGGLALLAWPTSTFPEDGAVSGAGSDPETSRIDPRRTVLLAGSAPGEIDHVLRDLQPLLALHAGGGEGKTWIGDTLCLTPVGPVSPGAVRGWVVDVGERGVTVAQPVQV